MASLTCTLPRAARSKNLSTIDFAPSTKSRLPARVRSPMPESCAVATGNCQLHIRRSCAPILTGSRSELFDTLGCAATGHAQLSK